MERIGETVVKGVLFQSANLSLAQRNCGTWKRGNQCPIQDL